MFSSVGIKIAVALGGVGIVLAIWHFTVEQKVAERLVEKAVAETRAEYTAAAQAADDSIVVLEGELQAIEVRVLSLTTELEAEEQATEIAEAAADSLGATLEDRAEAGELITPEEVRTLVNAHKAETASLNNRISLLEATVIAEREAKAIAFNERDVERDRRLASESAMMAMSDQIAILNRKAHPGIFTQAKRALPFMVATALVVAIAK